MTTSLSKDPKKTWLFETLRVQVDDRMVVYKSKRRRCVDVFGVFEWII